jgi:hypothetical protein
MSHLLDLRSQQHNHKEKHQGWSGAIPGVLIITAAFFLFVYALPALFQPMSCTVNQHSQQVVCQ